VRDIIAVQGGSIVGTSLYDYDPYGNLIKTSGSFTADFGYAGMLYEPNSGLDLTLYRAYSPRLQRWLSRDPLGESAGLNQYNYVNGNPVNNTDPLGLCDNPPGPVGQELADLAQLANNLGLSTLAAGLGVAAMSANLLSASAGPNTSSAEGTLGSTLEGLAAANAIVGDEPVALGLLAGAAIANAVSAATSGEPNSMDMTAMAMSGAANVASMTGNPAIGMFFNAGAMIANAMSPGENGAPATGWQPQPGGIGRPASSFVGP
jgi:RHS repeat-associated protein